ncbi:16S rRNA (cytidine(1402)-2'-O)-methyltransferase [Desulfobaculum sp.]|jgi:16S rRNA (cytidine1402-2'-O)-methyltransferase
MTDETAQNTELDAALYVVATPLGNADDLSPRAHRILAAADMVLAEDTRRTGQLFQRLGIPSHGFVSFHEHNEEKRTARVVEALEAGQSVAMVSDAGTPLLSDPGFTLVRACRERGITVVPVPGPSAPLTALSACGLPPLPFTFLGFPPRKAGDRHKFFAAHAQTGATLIFFERKNRLMETLQAAHDALGPREVCVARELTKTHEEFIHGRLDALTALDVPLLGEFTVVIGPPAEEAEAGREAVLAAIEEERRAGGKPRQVARRVAERMAGWSTKDVYALMTGEGPAAQGDESTA